MNVRTIALAVALLAVSASTAVAQTSPVGPIANGDFESAAVPEAAGEPLQGTPADECVGIGHQVLYGDETVQGDLTGGSWDDPTLTDTDPVGAVMRVAGDPVGEALFASGYGHCGQSEEKGYDLATVNPTSGGGLTSDDAAFWSHGSAQFGFDFDDDPFDKEARVPADASLSNHNMWQVLNRHNLFSADFDAFTFQVEDGEIPQGENARVSLPLSATPLHRQDAEAVVFFDCILHLPADAATPSADGTVSLDPTAGAAKLDDRSGDECDAAAEEFNDPETSADRRGEILGQFAIVQVSFWNFNHGDQDVVIDNVAVEGATTLPEQAAAGNAEVQPDADGPIQRPPSKDNGIVMMVHGTFEPSPTEPTPAPPAEEAFATTREGDQVVLRVIPHDVDTLDSITVEEPELRIEAPGLPDNVYTPEDSVKAADDPICEEEATLTDEGDTSADCLLFEIPAQDLTGYNAAFLSLWFDDGDVEVYNSASHILLHESIESGDNAAATAGDRISDTAIPYLIENLVDTGGDGPDEVGAHAHGGCFNDGEGARDDTHAVVRPGDGQDVQTPEPGNVVAGVSAFVQGGGSCDSGALGAKANVDDTEAGFCVTDGIYVQPDGADCWDPDPPEDEDRVAGYPLS